MLALRKRLYELGYYAKPNENALYTESTADVVRMFQQDCGLEETGTADPYTQALLFDDRMLAREGSAQEVTYLQNKAQPLYIQRAEITSYSFYGSVQVSVRNNTSGKLTAFGLKIIPNMSDGELVDMADTFAEQIERNTTSTASPSPAAIPIPISRLTAKRRCITIPTITKSRKSAKFISIPTIFRSAISSISPGHRSPSAGIAQRDAMCISMTIKWSLFPSARARMS
ncbi:MAG: peptidoglycan-binding domain-containing protein [Christensenellales bacterium]